MFSFVDFLLSIAFVVLTYVLYRRFKHDQDEVVGYRESDATEHFNDVNNSTKQFTHNPWIVEDKKVLPNYSVQTTELKFAPRFEDFLSYILQWDHRWLQVDQKHRDALPVVDKKRLTAMPLGYQSFEQYYETIEPLLAIETWHSICSGYEERNKNDECKVIPVSPSLIEGMTTLRGANLSIMDLEMVISQDDLKLEAHPFNGDLLLYHYASNTTDEFGSSSKSAFAYVTDLRKTVIRPRTLFNRGLLAMVEKPHTLITMTMMTKPLDLTDMQMHRNSLVQKITHIGSDMRKVQAFQQLYGSPFMNMILCPKIDDYQLPLANNRDEFRPVTKEPLNPKQLEVLIRVINAYMQNIPRICLIQGPPGTGKSTVIVNLVMQLLHGDDRCNPSKKLRILVCAPSNTAVDAIVVKLLKTRRSSDVINHFSLVRIGRIEKMHPEAKTVSLEEQSKNNDKELCTSHCVKCEPRLAQSANPKDRLLKNAQVIASTLSSSYTHSMQTAFSDQDDIVCIVDEASQCTEPESLIPLMLGIRVLILVGDPKQLPATVISQKAKDLGLDQSLFARIDTIFKDTSHNPIIQLNVQYRMSDPIALFPNNYFYDRMLKNSANVATLPFHSYRVINHNSAQDSVRLSNSGEADFVAKLLHAMYVQINDKNNTTVKLPITIGIITGYQLQKAQLIEKIEKRIPRCKDKIQIDYDVNTVDSFQGQERDVIIMSCVRSHGIGFLDDPRRLCVALTRAKHSLIICGNFKTFQKNRMWNALLKDAVSRGVYVSLSAKTDSREIGRHLICRTKSHFNREQSKQPEGVPPVVETARPVPDDPITIVLQIIFTVYHKILDTLRLMTTPAETYY